MPNGTIMTGLESSVTTSYTLDVVVVAQCRWTLPSMDQWHRSFSWLLGLPRVMCLQNSIGIIGLSRQRCRLHKSFCVESRGKDHSAFDFASLQAWGPSLELLNSFGVVHSVRLIFLEKKFRWLKPLFACGHFPGPILNQRTFQPNHFEPVETTPNQLTPHRSC